MPICIACTIADPQSSSDCVQAGVDYMTQYCTAVVVVPAATSSPAAAAGPVATVAPTAAPTPKATFSASIRLAPSQVSLYIASAIAGVALLL